MHAARAAKATGQTGPGQAGNRPGGAAGRGSAAQAARPPRPACPRPHVEVEEGDVLLVGAQLHLAAVLQVDLVLVAGLRRAGRGGCGAGRRSRMSTAPAHHAHRPAGHGSWQAAAGGGSRRRRAARLVEVAALVAQGGLGDEVDLALLHLRLPAVALRQRTGRAREGRGGLGDGGQPAGAGGRGAAAAGRGSGRGVQGGRARSSSCPAAPPASAPPLHQHRPSLPPTRATHLVVPAHHPDLAALRVQQVEREEAALAARVAVPVGGQAGSGGGGCREGSRRALWPVPLHPGNAPALPQPAPACPSLPAQAPHRRMSLLFVTRALMVHRFW